MYTEAQSYNHYSGFHMICIHSHSLTAEMTKDSLKIVDHWVWRTLWTSPILHFSQGLIQKYIEPSQSSPENKKNITPTHTHTQIYNLFYHLSSILLHLIAHNAQMEVQLHELNNHNQCSLSQQLCSRCEWQDFSCSWTSLINCCKNTWTRTSHSLFKIYKISEENSGRLRKGRVAVELSSG